MESLPWRADPSDPHGQQDTVDEGGHISDLMWCAGDRGMDALIGYIKWFRSMKTKDPSWDMDWVGRELVYDELAFEAYNKRKLTRNDPGGGMTYSEREDTIRHQNLDLWIMRWQTYGIWKRFKIDLLDFLEIEYPVAEWLIKRARLEEERRQEEMKKAEEEREENGEPPPAFSDIDELSGYMGLGDEE